MTTIATHLVEALVNAGVKRIYGVVGDSLNSIVDAVHQKVDCLAFIKRQQQTLRSNIGAVILLQNAEIAAALEVAQDDRIRLQMRRDVGDFKLVRTALQIERQEIGRAHV